MSSSVLRVGDLVVFRTSLNGDAWAPDDEFPPGIVINVKRRETASPHPNYSGKHPPIELFSKGSFSLTSKSFGLISLVRFNFSALLVMFFIAVLL